ncbi:hypothetical protein HMPREF0208_02466 [Citrobacter koseri]|nr:hypothetical protein HMPREF0208_02466 [Citrobacter koseri]
MSVSFKYIWQTSGEYYSQLALKVSACFRLLSPPAAIFRRFT